ncbi:D-allose ABC transporter permease [Tessaracoccus sp. Y36]
MSSTTSVTGTQSNKTNPQTPKPKTPTSWREQFTHLWGRYSVFAILALVVVVFSIAEPAFMGGNNPVRILEQSSVTILLAFGEFFAILLAGIDLSVGSNMALSGVVGAQLMVNGVPWIVAVLGAVLFGAFIGLCNGALIAATRLHPFIITLGTMSILRGVTYVVSDATAVAGLPIAFSSTINGRVLGIPVPIILVLVVLVFLTIFTGRTQAGRNLYAMGGSPQAAWFAGIPSTRHTLLAFTVSGLCAGMAGAVNIARLGAAEPNAGTGYETFAIAAVIIAGTSFFGGEGKIWKVLFGGLIIGVINNGLNMVGVSSYYQQIAMGSLIIIAVALDRFFGPTAARRS